MSHYQWGIINNLSSLDPSRYPLIIISELPQTILIIFRFDLIFFLCPVCVYVWLCVIYKMSEILMKYLHLCEAKTDLHERLQSWLLKKMVAQTPVRILRWLDL